MRQLADELTVIGPAKIIQDMTANIDELNLLNLNTGHRKGRHGPNQTIKQLPILTPRYTHPLRTDTKDIGREVRRHLTGTRSTNT